MDYIKATSEDFIKIPTPAHLQRNSWGCFENPYALGINAMGYGKKIRTIYKVEHEGKLFRVFATCFSNCASHWIMTKGKKLFVRD